MKTWQRIVLIVTGIALTVGIAVSSAFLIVERRSYNRSMDNIYKKAFFDASDNLDDIELKLSKLAVSEGKASQNLLLNDIWLDAELSADKFGTLSSKDASSEQIIKFLNQMGDYCKYLANKISDNPLTSQEKQKLFELSKIVTVLKQSLDSVSTSVFGGETLVGKLDEGISLLGDGYEHFNNDSTVEYPSMIYDGPFSDGLADRDARFIGEMQEVSTDAVINVVSASFQGAEDINIITETTGGIYCYLVAFKYQNYDYTASVSKKGGYIVELSSTRQVDNPTQQVNDLVGIAPEIVKQYGYNDMSVVWVANIDSTVYINLAYKQDGVVFYPDLVKIKMSLEDGSLIGLDAKNYIYNHTARVTPTGTNTVEEARARVSHLLTITSTALTVIPTEWNTEIVAYEFAGTYDGGEYYVYISADTLEEIKVMRVIEANGSVLIA